MARAARKTQIKVDSVALTPNEGASLIVGSYFHGNLKRTLLFRGSPGIGKSSLARQAADELRKTYPDFKYIEINPTMPAEEVGGIPSVVRKEGLADRMDYAIPTWVPTKAEQPDFRAIINLDDALQGDRMMQQTLANLILARNLRGHELPDGVMIVATGNRVEDKAGVTRTLTHFADRMCWIDIVADPQAWVQDYAVPKNLHPKVVGYIMTYPDKLDMFNPDAIKCPTPRTWAAVSDRLHYLDTLPDGSFKTKMAQATLAGELGQGEAIEFWAYCDLWGKMPDLDAIEKDPENASIEYELSVQYATALALAQRINGSNLGNILKYIDRIGPDLSTVAVKLAMHKDRTLMETEAWQDWAAKNQDAVH